MFTNAMPMTSTLPPKAPGNESKYRTDLRVALGAFLVSAAPGSVFGYGDCWFDECWWWEPEYYGKRIGEPIGATTVSDSGMQFAREWEGVHVAVDCTGDGSATFDWTAGS